VWYDGVCASRGEKMDKHTETPTIEEMAEVFHQMNMDYLAKVAKNPGELQTPEMKHHPVLGPLLSDIGTIAGVFFMPFAAIAALFGVTIWRQTRG